jgi:hypothetical protein
MLTKLLKYEFLSTGRIFLPLYLTLVGVSAILKLFITIERSIDLMIVPQVLFTLLYVVLIVAVFALVYILACMRFYRNLLGDEGYLMHTLPVKPYEHVLAKLITSIVWMLASIAVAILSVIVLAYQKGFFRDMFNMLGQLLEAIGVYWSKPSFTFTVVSCLVLAVVTTVTGFMMFYASMAVGQLLRGHRIVGSILAYFGFYTISQIISLIMVLVLSRTEIWEALEAGNLSLINMGAWNPFSAFFTIAACLNLVLCVSYFVITNYMLRRKLNLE